MANRASRKDRPQAGPPSGAGLSSQVDSPARPTVAVGAVAVDEGRLLVVRRSKPPEAGRWTLPGGRVERGETVAEALEREMREETGLAVRCGALRGWAERISPGYHYVILDFDVNIIGEPEARAGGDAAEVAWVPFERIDSLDMVSGLVEFLRDNGVIG